MSDNTVATGTIDNPALDILRRAKQLISVPERWTTKAAARDQLNREVGATDPFACRWCLLGALRHAAPPEPTLLATYEPFWDARRIASTAATALGFGARTEGSTPTSAVVDANDNGGFSAVHKVLDRAIYMAGEAK